MGNDTVNPIKLAGTYLGTLAGLLLFLKGWHIFWWLPSLFGVNINSLFWSDIIGGLVVGYVLHILWREMHYHVTRVMGKK
jgi:hypothetical protein